MPPSNSPHVSKRTPIISHRAASGTVRISITTQEVGAELTAAASQAEPGTVPPGHAVAEEMGLPAVAAANAEEVVVEVVVVVAVDVEDKEVVDSIQMGFCSLSFLEVELWIIKSKKLVRCVPTDSASH